MTDWQDIETAPKDGTLIDLWVVASSWRTDISKKAKKTSYRLTDAWWGEPYGDYFNPKPQEKTPQWCCEGDRFGEYWIDAVEEDITSGMNKEFRNTAQCTHWMPLPEPPKESQ